MGETWNKRERELKKKNAKKRKDEKRQERKENTDKGKSLDDMMAYVDEFGNLSDTPPEKKPARPISDIPPVVANSRDQRERNTQRKGTISFFDSSKGYGFIKDSDTKESIFVHANSATIQLKENLKVAFEVQRSPKGLSAVNVNESV